MDYPGFQLKGDMMVRWKKKIKWAWLLVKYTIYRVQKKKEARDDPSESQTKNCC